MPYQGSAAYPYQQPSMAAYPQNNANAAYQMPAIPAPLAQTQHPGQNAMILDWVQGPEAASAYYVAPGRGAILMDINRHTFYLTSRGEDNIPRPLQTFDYKLSHAIKSTETVLAMKGYDQDYSGDRGTGNSGYRMSRRYGNRGSGDYDGGRSGGTEDEFVHGLINLKSMAPDDHTAKAIQRMIDERR